LASGYKFGRVALITPLCFPPSSSQHSLGFHVSCNLQQFTEIGDFACPAADLAFYGPRFRYIAVDSFVIAIRKYAEIYWWLVPLSHLNMLSKSHFPLNSPNQLRIFCRVESLFLDYLNSHCSSRLSIIGGLYGCVAHNTELMAKLP
jgi:hypothetical protein